MRIGYVRLADDYLDHLVNPPMVIKKEKQMGSLQHTLNIQAIQAERSETELQRRYLIGEIDSLYRDHKAKLQEQHGLTDQDPPKTWKDLKARLEAGDFQYDGKDEDHEHYNALNHLRWRKKGQKEDTAGYKAAKLKLKAAYSRAKDEIIILDLPAALEAKRKFESLH